MPLSNILYPYDETGINQTNLVVNEQHIVTESNYRDYYFVIPKFNPFFIENMIVTQSINGAVRTMVQGVEYVGCLPYIGASRSIGKQIYGGISFTNPTITGVVSLKYQTLGGQYLFDDQVVLENIANRVYNPRIVTYEQVTDRPTLFPPTNHVWNLVDQVGQSDVVAALIRIEQAILTRVTDAFNLHVTRVDNPHNDNKEQIGLGLVENFPPATLTEAKDLLATNRLITPATLKAVLLQYDALKLSADPGNLIVVKPDGIYYSVAKTKTASWQPNMVANGASSYLTIKNCTPGDIVSYSMTKYFSDGSVSGSRAPTVLGNIDAAGNFSFTSTADWGLLETTAVVAIFAGNVYISSFSFTKIN